MDSAQMNKTIQLLEQLKKRAEQISTKSVVVGVPKSKDGRKDDMTNAGLAMIHEFGSPADKIPERSFLRSTMADKKQEIGEVFCDEVKAYLNNEQSLDAAYSITGEIAASLVKERFTDNNWQPNSIKTVKEKKSDKPLIDTGSLRQSITFEVRDNES